MTAAGRRLALLLAAVILGAVVVTLVEGAPSRLPGVALGSPVLLHAERAGAIAEIVVALASILTQAARGRLPTQLSTAGLAYEAEAAANTQAALETSSARSMAFKRESTGSEPSCSTTSEARLFARWRRTPLQPATRASKPARCSGWCANAMLRAASECCDTPPTSAASPRSCA